MKKITEIKWLKKIMEKAGSGFFVMLGLVGVFLIFMSEMDFGEKPVKNKASREEYRLQLEENLSELLSTVEGAGKVNIMVTLESGEENVYAWQEKTSRDEQTVSADLSEQVSQRTSYENEIVMVGENGSKQALVEKTLQPSVQGVVVVCQGADDIKVVSNITNAVSVALNVPSNRICVIKMQ